MLRPASRELIDRLLRSAHDIDLELDSALVQLGILPPLDLEPIRDCLSQEGTELAAGANADGHRILFVSVRGRTTASIRHDGCVTAVGQTTVLASA